MKNFKNLIRGTIMKKTNHRYLQYYPTKGKDWEPIKEPQELKHYYKYIYNEDILQETFLYAEEHVKSDPYIEATFYEWDNISESRFLEFFEMTPNFLKVLTVLFVFSLVAQHFKTNQKNKRNDSLEKYSKPYYRISEPLTFYRESY
jgi:hypothetical protein